MQQIEQGEFGTLVVLAVFGEKDGEREFMVWWIQLVGCEKREGA